MKNNKLILSLASVYLLYCFLLAVIAPILIKAIIPEQARNFINGEVRINGLSINPFNHTITLKDLTLLNSEANKLVSFDTLSVNIDLLPFILLNVDIPELELRGLQVFTGESAVEPWLRLPQLVLTDTSVAITQQDVIIKNIFLDQIKLSAVLMNNQSTNVQLFIDEIDQLLISENTEALRENDNEAKSISNDANLQVETTLNESELTDTIPKDTSNTDTSNTDTANTNIGNNSSELAKETSAENNSEHETEESPWLVHITHIDINAANISILDQNTRNEHYPDGINTVIAPINIELSSIESDLSQDIKLNIDAQLFKGKLNIKGSVNPHTLASQISYSLDALQLSELNTYVEHFSFASISSGSFSSQGQVESFSFTQSNNTDAGSNKNTVKSATSENIPSENILQVKVSNTSLVKMLSVKHQNFETPLLNCENIESKNLNYVLVPSSLNLDNFSVQRCTFKPTIYNESATNFDLAKASNTQSAQKKADGQSEKDAQQQSLIIDIKLIELIDNAILIEDFSQSTKVTLDLKNLQAKLENLAEGNTALSVFQLSAMLNDHAPLSIKGNGNFLNPKLSTISNITLKNLGLKEFSPYALNLSSRPIEKGVLALDIDIKALENKLNSHASISLLGLNLGKKHNVEGASKLPIGLALGILKDSKGDIHINVPIKGDLDDPTFSITKQVIKTLTGIITKAATAPLSMMGGLVTGGDNTDSLKILFAAQIVLIDDAQQKKISEIANVLKKRPELSIRISSLLGSNERIDIVSEDQQTEILNIRQQNVFNALLAEGVSELQLEKLIFENAIESEESQVLLEFFAR